VAKSSTRILPLSGKIQTPPKEFATEWQNPEQGYCYLVAKPRPPPRNLPPSGKLQTKDIATEWQNPEPPPRNCATEWQNPEQGYCH